MTSSYHQQLASEVMDEALIGAVYPTDADGMPAVAAHIVVFGREWCAQVAFRLVTGDPQNVKPQFASTSMAGVSLTRAVSAQGGVLPRLAPRAGIILHTVSSGWRRS
jgi:hypothetical protein